MLLFRTSYREYISLQITETFCRNGKFKINCHHVYCQFDKLEIIVLSNSFLMEPSSSQSSSRRTVQSTEEKLKRRRECDRACRHAETAQQREQRLSKRTVQDRARHAARATEDREARLQQLRDRRAAEMPEQTGARFKIKLND